ncbi:FCD domain-containing protein [Cypionkella sinensis]|uniref:FCD domain-containing protein n=1 Tax=Cypionkella sinensis TaxID=1756043 RepID=A0ABV7J6X6_9RHOB
MTLAETAYDALRRDIVRGVLAPGKPLRMAQLSERYGMGFSPLREALNRLQAERLVTSIALRGFSVAPLSMAEMWDTINTRVLIEQRALRLAMAQGGDDWETGIVSALHSLTLQSTRAAEGGADEQKLLEDRHHGFHLALIAGCGSSWLLEFFQRLYAEAERYRYPMLQQRNVENHRDIQAEHAALAKATLARDADLACDLLAEHYLRTARFIEAQMTAAPQAQSA